MKINQITIKVGRNKLMNIELTNWLHELRTKCHLGLSGKELIIIIGVN